MPFGFSRRDDGQTAALASGFRPDIEGLRAVAVLAVVFFHLKMFPFGGGFLGVDMFFVISGYLITRNIVADVDASRFSFAKFYGRRIRRIFPAMLATVAVTLMAGALWFPPPLFVNLAKSGAASLGFFANVYFWSSAQRYFSPDSSLLPLLHLWSLSVEEQFYIFWPLAVLTIAKVHVSGRFLCIGTIGAVFFALAILMGRFDASAVFYLMPFRIYQFCLGAMVLGAERWARASVGIQRLAQLTGFVICAVGIFALGSHLRFQAVAPSLGAALIIYGGSEGASMPALTNRLARYIGQISYSLYLVHWPVTVFANYILGPEAFGPYGLVVQIAVMFVLAELSYRFIERPFVTQHASVQKKPVIRTLIIASGALGLISLAVIAGDGWNWRLNAAQRRLNELESFGAAPCARDATTCDFGTGSGRISAMLIGDSYAQHYVSAIDEIARGLGVRVEEQIQQGCLVLSGLVKLGYPDDRCWTGRDRVLAAITKSTAPVIISEAWLGYTNGNIGDDRGRSVDASSETKRLAVLREGLERTIAGIARPGRKILIIGAQVLATCDFNTARLGAGPLPHRRDAPCPPRSREDAHRVAAGVNSMLMSVQARRPNTVSVIFPEDYMCDQVCPSVHDGVWLYEDAGHLTVAGSLRFGERARGALSDFLMGEGLPGRSSISAGAAKRS